MTKSTANFLSTLGHPFVLLPLVFAFLSVHQVGFERAWPTLLAIVGCLAAMGIFLFFRKRQGKISNWDVSTRSERSRNIYLPVLVLVLLIATLLYVSQQPFWGETLFFGLMMLTCYAINARLKISQHTLMVFYLSMLLLAVDIRVGIPMLILAPLVGWSRVVLGRHQTPEVLAGATVGLIFGALQNWIF
jgi:membrane-associated phospholipid phosphatase